MGIDELFGEFTPDASLGTKELPKPCAGCPIVCDCVRRDIQKRGLIPRLNAAANGESGETLQAALHGVPEHIAESTRWLDLSAAACFDLENQQPVRDAVNLVMSRSHHLAAIG